MDAPLNPTIFFLHCLYSWFLPAASHNFRKLQYFQNNQVCRYVEIYQTPWYEKIYIRFFFPPKKGNWYSTHKYVAKNTGQSWQYEWLIPCFPYLHVHEDQK